MTRIRHPRINCLVPHCRRGTTRFPEGQEYLCERHWPQTDAGLRHRYHLARRRLGRRGEYDPTRCVSLTPRAARVLGGMWARLTEQAIERGAGL